jgi:predicted glycosyltransferase involved in capsule biosynthesis
MENQTIKGAFIGAGALLAVLILGVFVFSYFNNQVTPTENTISVITVKSSDGTKDLGLVFVDMGTLTSTVTDTDFKTYYDANKIQLAEATYTYEAETLDSTSNTVILSDVSTVRSDSDFVYGLVKKMSTDLKDKYLLTAEELVVSE